MSGINNIGDIPTEEMDGYNLVTVPMSATHFEIYNKLTLEQKLEFRKIIEEKIIEYYDNLNSTT